jgi:cytidylate kinase
MENGLDKDRATVVITISRQLGSGGSYIGRLVAERLGFAYIDRQILQQAARELGVKEEEIEDREERLQSFWEKLVPGFAMASPYPNCMPPLLWFSDEELAALEHRLIAELVVKGPCVVIGRGAFHLLRDKAKLLSVMIHAPMEFRVERVMSTYKVQSKAEAVQMIERSDHDRCGCLRAFTGLDWFDARNYHLTIDTGKVDFTTAEEMISSLAGRLQSDKAWSWVKEPV